MRDPQPITIYEEEKDYLINIVHGGIKDFLKAETRIQLLAIFLWLYNDKDVEENNIEFKRLSKRQHLRISKEILVLMTSTPKDVQNLDGVTAYGVFTMACNVLSQKYPWLHIETKD